MPSYRISLDDKIRFGSAEHFYHFMWGYLLPACHLILQTPTPTLADGDRLTFLKKLRTQLMRGLKSAFRTQPSYIVRSCGPLMDPLIAEVFGTLGVPFTIRPKTDLEEDHGADELLPPRWDIWIDTVWFDASKESPGFPTPDAIRAEHFHQVRQQLLDLFLPPAAAENSTAPHYLLLRRSPEHPFYHQGGSAEIPNYGTGRRELHGIEEGRDYLNQHGIPCVIFEAGKHSLREQINAFHRCRGIIAMRGAEVANMIWMRPGSKVILYNPVSEMHIRPPSRALASLFEIDYTEVDIGGALHPTLDAPALLALLTKE